MKFHLSELRAFTKYNAVFLLCSFLAVAFLSGFGLKSGDYDAFHSMNYLDPGVMIERWSTWTSRTAVDWSMSFSAHNVALFLIISVSLIWLLLHSTNRIVTTLSNTNLSNTKDNVAMRLFIGLSFLVLINFGMFTSAGVIATVVGFLWTLSLLIYGSTILLDDTHSARSLLFKYASLLYATCVEQVAVIVVLGVIAYGVYQYVSKKKLNLRLLLVPFLVGLAQTIHALLNPGNHVRSAKEVVSWFPQYEDLNIIRKLDIGFVDTMQHLFINPFWVVTTLVITLAFIAYKKRMTNELILSGFLSVLLLFYRSPQNYIINTVNNVIASWNIKYFDILLSTNGVTKTGHGLASFVPDIYFLSVSAAVLYVLLKICTSFKERYVILAILFIGFGSRMIMALSPTIYASADRTFTYLIFSIYLVLLYLIASRFTLTTAYGSKIK